MKSKNKKRFWGLFCGYLFSILFLTSGLVLSVTSALSLATINAGGKFNFIVPVPDESVYTGILKFYDPDSTALTISVCADPSTKSNSSYPSEVEIPSKIQVNDVTYTITIVGSFSGCSNLQSITIPDSATTINSSIYSSTTGAGVTDSLGAFENCTNLQSINIPSGIQSIATGAFSGCTGITTMTVASENTKYYSAGNAIITKADKTLVAGCKNTVIPNDVLVIGERAFRRLTNLTSITIPTSVKTLGSSAFAFSGLTSVSVPSGVTSIASNAFAFCTSLGTISVDSANTKYKGEGNAIIEKATEKLIAGCRNTVIPSYVKEIGSYAFQGHPITSVTIPASTTIIDAYAFMGCSWLTSATFETDFGWKVNGTAIDVASSTSTNATNLKTTHVSKTWIQATPTVDEYTDFEFTFFDNADGTYTASVRAKDTNTISGAKRIPTLVAKTAGGTDYVVNKIEANGFQGATNLTSIEIPDTIIEIEDYGFAASGLTSVVVPGSVKKLGEQAFAGTGLGDIFLNDGLETIGYAAFHTSGLTSITIPSTVTSVGAEAFYGCNNLQSVNILAQIDKIEDSMFVECYKLTDFTMPDSVKEIGVTSFTDCTSLKTIRLSQNLEKIGVMAFARSGLTSITIPASVTTIDNSYESVFDACDSLTSVTFENANGWKAGDWALYLGVPSQNAQYITTDYREVAWTRGDSQIFDFTFNADSTASVKAYDDATINGGIVIPTLAMGSNGSTYTVNKVEDNGFAYQSDLNSVIFPDSIRVIGESAFASTGLGDITLNEGLESIGYAAFHTSGLTSITIPNSVTSIGEYAFYNADSLNSVVFEQPLGWRISVDYGTSVYLEVASQNAEYLTDTFYEASWIQDDLDAIDLFTFTYNPSDQTATLIGANKYLVYPNFIVPALVLNGGEVYTLTTIGNGSSALSAYWFEEMKLTIPNTITTISDYALKGWPIKSFIIPSSVKTIGKWAFAESTLSSIDIPDNVTSLGTSAFESCTDLKHVNIGSGIPYIPESCFSNSGVEAITIPSTITTIGNEAFYNCYGVNPTISHGVKTIGKWAFANCTSISSSIVIPNSVTSLGEGAFSNNESLNSVTLGTGITEIPANCFESNLALYDFTIPSTITKIGESAFDGCTNLTSATFENIYGWHTNAISFDYENIGNSIVASRYLVNEYTNSVWTCDGLQDSTALTKLIFTITDSNNNYVSVKKSSASITGDVIIPSAVKIDGEIYTVTSTANNAFDDCSLITRMVLPETLIRINSWSFCDTTKVTSIVIPARVEFIGYNTFQNAGIVSAVFEDTVGWYYGGSAISVIADNTNATNLKKTSLIKTWEKIKDSTAYAEFTFTNFDSSAKTCYVQASSTSVSGNLRIPSKVRYNNATYSVTTIEQEGFMNCANITGIYIPSSITVIGTRAFACTSNLGKIVVASGNSVYKSINNSVIEKDTNTLVVGCKNTIIDSSVVKIGYSAFRGAGVENITIPENVKVIDEWAFYQTKLLDSVIIEGAIEIKYGAFAESTIESISLPSTLVVIEERVFMNSYEINNVVIPASVANIGANAFTNCRGLTNISFESIGDWHAHNSQLSSTVLLNVSINSTANWIKYLTDTYKDYELLREASFYSSLTFTNYNSSAKTCSVAAKSTSISGLIAIPNKIYYGGAIYTVTAIVDNGFSGCNNVTSIIIPYTITTIGNDGLKGTGITELFVPSSVTYMRPIADSPNIAKMVVDASNTVYYSSGNCIIERSSMKLLTGCYNATIPSGVKIIGDWAFSGKHTLTSITLPSSLTRIEVGAFGWSKLESITIPSNVIFIQAGAFAGTNTLTSITFNTTTGWNVDGVGSVDVTDTAQNASWLKDGGAYSNKDWTRPTVDDYSQLTFTFNDSANTASVKATDPSTISGNISIPGVIRKSGGTTVYTVTGIDDLCFYKASNLTGVSIPNTITSIGASAFERTGLTSITISDKVT